MEVSSYIASHSSCYSSKTRHLLISVKKFSLSQKATEAFQSITKLDYKVNLFKGKKSKLRR